MQFLTHKNHFQFGYNGQYFNDRASPNDIWNVKYGEIDDNSSGDAYNFRSACIATASAIREDFRDKEIWLLFSGGIDSEVMIRAFKAAHIEFKVAIMRFENGYNQHDIDWAINCCHTLKITPTFFDLNVKEFLTSAEAYKFAEQTRCAFPEMLPHMWLMEKISKEEGGIPVMGSGEPLLVKMVPGDYRSGYHQYFKSDWYIHEKESIAGWYRFLAKNNMPGVAGFFQYTPEIMLSYMIDPVTRDLINDRNIGKLTSVSSKFELFSNHFPLDHREKYTGYEKIYDFIEVEKKKLHALYDDSRQIHRTKCDTLIGMLWGNNTCYYNDYL
jgi:hypothetical protein